MATRRSCQGLVELSLGRTAGAGPGGLTLRPQRDIGGPQPTQRGLLADPVTLADLGGAQPFGQVQADKLLTVGCLTGTARQPPRDAGIGQPPSNRRRGHPIARRQLSNRHTVGSVAAAQLHRGRRETASSALGLGSQRDVEPPQPGTHGTAAHTDPLGDFGRDQPLLLIQPAQLGRRDAAGHPTARPGSLPEGWGTPRPPTPHAVLDRPISRPAGSRSRPSPSCTGAPPPWGSSLRTASRPSGVAAPAPARPGGHRTRRTQTPAACRTPRGRRPRTAGWRSGRS
jgi:hypothetical protein